MLQRSILKGALALLAVFVPAASSAANSVGALPTEDTGAFHLVVMDPLAAPLSCPCVDGYAQRRYEKLGEYLETKLGKPVQVFFTDALSKVLKNEAQGRADLIIGKDSVVRYDMNKHGGKLVPLAKLTGKDGRTDQTGLIVVRKDDPAKSIGDLEGYRIIFGPADCDEKHKAILTMLRKAKISVPDKLETAPACSAGASKLVELASDVKAATVISSYAEPLLEGCGTIKKGDLRIVATSESVPFISAFTTPALSPSDREALVKALLEVDRQPMLKIHLETLRGFVPYAKKKGEAKAAPQEVGAVSSKATGKKKPQLP